ncbi:1-aminocyclopropane-1-carboxylate synthase-like protein 1 isoform 2-T5 [Anomaloglossus baeobatrachus]|uniref:1-aminocyclopropane-1-carboxylate synthase-like protein 1 isoform X2 n=1 Tax=Anomaloglossus baeobatrachus TaxID=238106 RepID=UPI003F50A650
MESLSARGRELVSESDFLVQGFMMALQDPYEKQSNPHGFVNFGTAENKVCFDLLKERLTRPDMNYLEPKLLEYNNPAGIKSLREEAARFLTDYCHSPVPLNPNNIVIMNGCNSILCALSAVICDPGDGLLTPTPYYSRIALYTGVYSGLQPVYVPLNSQVTEDHSLSFSLTIEKLEEGMEKAKQQGIKVKALVLINPQNPLGEVYSPHLLKECLEFASRYSLHVIVDEIYMLSVMDVDFTSVLSFQDLPDPKRTHFIWGLSKDFGMSGLRVGMLYTENEHVVNSVTRLGTFHQCSGITQYMVYQLLRDRDWLDNVFFPTNKERLRESQATVVTALEELRIPVLHRSTGMYVWADFRKTFEAEMDLWKRFIAEKLVISPGKAFECGEPGWFRLTTSIPEDLLQVVLERLRKALQSGPTIKSLK